MAKTINGKFVIKSAKFPSYALNVYGTSVSSGKNVCLYPYNESDKMQQWVPQAQGNNVYKLSTAQVGSCKTVIDHYRVKPVDNCDVYTSGYSGSDGTLTSDLLDQQVTFYQGYDGKYTIFLYEDGKENKVLTCANTVNQSGVGTPSSITATNNVYWAIPSSSLGDRQKWTISQVVAKSADTILPYAQPYIQRDNTWAYLASGTDFNDLGCGVCALTTCGAIINKNNSLTPATCRKDGGFTFNNLSANWSIYGIDGGEANQLYENDPEGGYKRIYDEITAGNPVIVRVSKASGPNHYVTAYGYTYGTKIDNITSSRILIIDPYNPEFATLQELLDGTGGKFLYIFVKA